MKQLKDKVTVGIVGGSDYCKITEQLGTQDFLSFPISLGTSLVPPSSSPPFSSLFFCIGGSGGAPIEKQFPYVFSENGLVAFKVSIVGGAAHHHI